MHAAKQFNDLQALDLKYAAVETSLVEVRAKLADDSAVSSARDRLDRLQSQLKDLASRRRETESAIAQLRERLQAIETRLYGGAITNARELTAADEEREFILRQQREEEDQLLELMVEAEELQLEERDAQETLARLEAEGPAEKAQLLNTEQRLAGEIVKLGKSRDEVAPQMQSRALSLYESLRKAKNGYAVAKVERGMCQGCRLTLSTMELQRARSSQGIVQCSSCSRILYAV
jgi:predicted  nucleic acid-binding Zn-ribbon protein